MARGDMDFVLRADVGNAVRGLIEVIEKQKMSAKELEKFNEIGKKTGLNLESTFKNVIGMLGIGGGISGGLVFLRQQTQAWGEDVKQVVQKFTDVNKELVLAISRSGDLANFAEIQERLKNIPMPGIGPAERTGIYRALRAELPMENIETIMKLLPVVGKAKIFEDPKEFAARMGTTYQLYRGKLGAGDVADVTKVVGDMLGANVEKYGTQVFKQAMQLQAMGMDIDKALAMMIAAAEQGQLAGTGGAVALTGLLMTEKTFEKRRLGQRFTTQEKAEREFYAIEDPLERLQWLIANQGKGGKAAAVMPKQGALAAISQANIEQIAENIRLAREKDYFEMSRRLAIGTQPGEMLLRKEETKALVERTEIEAGKKFAETDIARDLLRVAYMRKFKRGAAFPITYGLNKAILETLMFFGVPPEEAVMKTPLITGRAYVPPAQYEPPAMLPSRIQEAFSEKTLPSKDIQELTKAIKDLTVVEKNKQNNTGYYSRPGPDE